MQKNAKQLYLCTPPDTHRRAHPKRPTPNTMWNQPQSPKYEEYSQNVPE